MSLTKLDAHSHNYLIETGGQQKIRSTQNICDGDVNSFLFKFNKGVEKWTSQYNIGQ